MISLFGSNWLIRKDNKVNQSTNEPSESKFISLLTHLICIEIRIQLEQIAIDIKANLVNYEKYSIVSSCYFILESLLAFLSSQRYLLFFFLFF